MLHAVMQYQVQVQNLGPSPKTRSKVRPEAKSKVRSKKPTNVSSNVSQQGAKGIQSIAVLCSAIQYATAVEMASYQQYGASDRRSGDTSRQVSENKTSLVLQSIYVLNKSGTKRVTLGMDPGLDFEPIVHLHKPGFEGMRMCCASWHELMKVAPHISSYFKGEMRAERARDDLFLSNLEKVQFRQQYGRYLISISSTMDDKKEVVFASATWYRLLELSPLINHCLAMFITWQSEVMELFTSCVRAAKSKISVHGPAAHHPSSDLSAFNLDHLLVQRTACNAPTGNGENVVKSLMFNHLDFVPKTVPFLDYMKCFFELQNFCTDEIMNFVSYV